MTEPVYKLVYFNLRGRGELIRLTLHACDIPFIDERVEFPDWPKLKTTIPGGKLPSLQVTNANDGKVTHYDESMAIARWIAHKYHILGETDEEFYKIERMIGKCTDLEKEFFKVFMGPPDKKEDIQQEIMKDTVPTLLSSISTALEESGGRFVAGDKPTLGDLFLMVTIDHVLKADPLLLQEKYKSLFENRDQVLAKLPKLRNYVDTRPDTAF